MKIILKAHLKRQSDVETKRKALIEKYSKEIQKVFKVKESVVPNIVDQIMNISVTSTKSDNEEGKPIYAEWIIQKFLKDNSGLTPHLINGELEDGLTIVEFLKPFHLLKNDPNSGLKKDISQYRTFSDLVEAVGPLQKTEKLETKELKTLKDLKEKVGKADLPGLTTLWQGKLDGDDYWIYRAEGTDPKTLDSLTLLAGKMPYVCSGGKHCVNKRKNQKCTKTATKYIEGKWYCSLSHVDERNRFKEGCSWCTIRRDTNSNYLRSSPITTIYKNGQPWAQTHPSSSQFNDKKNDSIPGLRSKMISPQELDRVLMNIDDGGAFLTTYLNIEDNDRILPVLEKLFN